MRKVVIRRKFDLKHGIWAWLNFEVYRFWEPSEEAIMISKGREIEVVVTLLCLKLKEKDRRCGE